MSGDYPSHKMPLRSYSVVALREEQEKTQDPDRLAAIHGELERRGLPCENPYATITEADLESHLAMKGAGLL